MKKEIYRLFVNPIFKITLILAFLMIFFITIYNSFSMKTSETDILGQGIILAEYNTPEDVDRYLSRAREELNDLDSDSVTYEQTKMSLEYRIQLYEYLQEHFIPYRQLVDSGILSSAPTENFYSFHAKTLSYLMIVVLWILLVLNYVVFSVDFDNLSYKYIYVKGNKTRLFFKKSVLIFSSSVLFVLLVCIIVSLYGIVSDINHPQYLLFFNQGSLNIMNRGQFIFWDSLSMIGFTMAMGVLLMGIFGIFKKTIYGFLVFSVYVIGINSLSLITENQYLLSLFTLPIYAYYDQTLWLNLTFNIGMSFLVYGISISLFSKRDLLY